jgi:hypothetical protein
MLPASWVSVKCRRAARRLLLRSVFKQPVADLLRHEALRPLPCLVIVPRNVKNFLNTTRWDVVSMATVCASCTSVLIL